MLLMFGSVVAFGQTAKEEVEYFQTVFGMKKQAVVQAFLDLDDTDEFWPIYNDYEEARRKLGTERLELTAKYIESYGEVTPAELDAMVKENISIRKASEDLMAKYYKKVKKVSGEITATKFYQLECFFITAVSAELYNAIPLVGELD